MKKENLKWYEAPQVEIVEMEVSASLLAGSDKTNADDTTVGGDPVEN